MDSTNTHTHIQPTSSSSNLGTDTFPLRTVHFMWGRQLKKLYKMSIRAGGDGHLDTRGGTRGTFVQWTKHFKRKRKNNGKGQRRRKQEMNEEEEEEEEEKMENGGGEKRRM
ncbi:hypothetical protein niasHS_005368 [Heterodera schachtii]|uniref:Uncharacterized protein n=1 Tax=Heterodera schachtii TaxID=97005 RepID=A0ABD2J990_HETSC